MQLPEHVRALCERLPAPVRVVETHISTLLLTPQSVYKFKKPLALGFLDYTSLASRRDGCEEEVRLNRRTAPQLYRGVVAVVGRPEAPELVPLHLLPQQAEPLDYAVHMQRFDEHECFDELIRHQRLEAQDVDRLARHVADFHDRAAVADASVPWGQPDHLIEASLDNFDALLPYAATAPAAALRQPLAALQKWTTGEARRLRPWMQQRREQGRVRECHGDLHLGNVVRVGGEPVLFDAIEFNPAFRWVDVMADLAFLVMDFHARGRPDLAWRALNEWLDHTADRAGLVLLPFFLVYRALVRAKVAVLRLGQLDAGTDQALQVAREVADYVGLAERFTRPAQPMLWLACGVSGSGKSSQSQPLVEALGLVRVRSDVERKRLFGLKPLESSARAGPPEGIYTSEASARTYEVLRREAEVILQAGFSVLLDATFLRRAHRVPVIALAQRLGVPCRVLVFSAPEPLLRERIRHRAAEGRDASEADEAVMQRQLREWEPVSPEEGATVWALDTTQSVDWADVLARQGPG